MKIYSKRDWTIAIVLAVVMILIISMHLTLGINSWGDDWAAYLAEGIAISQNTFDEQTAINYYLHPSSLPLDANGEKLVYVWGYPLFLSIVHRIVGFDLENFSSIIFYKIPSLIALSFTISILFLFYRKRFTTQVSLFLVLMFAVSGDLIHSVETLNSDILFLFFSLLSIWLAEYFLDILLNCSKIAIQILLSVLLAMILWICYETRLNGQSVVIAVAVLNTIVLIQNKTKWSVSRFSINAFTYILFFCLVSVSETILAPATPNLSDIGAISIMQFLGNIQYYGGVTCKYLGRSDSIIGYIVGFGIGLIFLVGFIQNGFKLKNIHLSGLLAGTYVVLVLLPYHQGVRYIYNILPIILMYVAHGALYIYARLSETTTGKKHKTVIKQTALISAVFTIAFVYSGVLVDGMQNIKNDRRGNETDVYSIEAIDMYHYIQDNTSADSSIAFYKPRVLYLNTGRLCFAPYNNGHVVAAADYFLYYKHSTHSLQNKILSDSNVTLAPLYENDSFTLYSVFD